MTEPLYRKGDVVEVVRRGTIVDVDPKDPALYGIGDPNGSGAEAYFRTDDDKVRHTLVTAAEWPPVPGDVWRDRNGARWMTVAIDCPECGSECEDGYVALTSEFGARYPGNLQLLRAVRYYGPFRLEIPGRIRAERGSS